MALSRLAYGLLLTAGLYQSAAAEVISSVRTSVEGQNGFFENFDLASSSTQSVHGRSSTLYTGAGSAEADTGSLSCGGPFQSPCFSTGNSNAAAFALSRASGATGSLHVSASANAQPTTGTNVASATASAGLRDKITFQGAPLISIDLDLSRSGSGEEWNHGLIFTLDLCFAGGCGVSSFDLLTLSLTQAEGPLGDHSVYTLKYLDANGVFQETQGASIPSDVSLTVDLSFLGEFEFEIAADFSVFAEGRDGSTSINADHSLYLKMDNVLSESGYTYAGRLVEEPPPTGIPAPPSFILSATGLAAFAWGRRRSQAA